METAGHGEKGEGDGGKGTAAGGLLCSCMYFVRMVLCNICMHVCVHVCMYGWGPDWAKAHHDA